MSELLYAIYSPSRDKWLNADGEYGLCSEAEKFASPEYIIALDGDHKWVGPIAEGEYP